MHIRQTLTVAMIAAGIGGLILPVLAQERSGAGDAPDQGMSMDRGMDRGMGAGMMGAGMMGRSMISGGCGGMMQSMGHDGRPNSQWQTHRPDRAEPG